MNYIYIINKHGKPLMPTTRQSHIRKLIKSGRAVVVYQKPFTVKLKYETDNITQPLYAGMDTGRENIGEAVTKANGECIFLCCTETKNKSIKIKTDERRAHRVERRRHNRQRKQRKAITQNQTIQKGQDTILRNSISTKSVNISYPGMDKSVEHKAIKGKEAKFNNRKRPEGWLTPSGRQLIQMHLFSLKKTLEILPITDFTIERVAFDFQKLENDDIDDWQHGPLYGYDSYKDCVDEMQHGKCLLCGKNHIDQYHHIVPRGKGGSNTINNIAGLCNTCHNDVMGVHKSDEASKKLSEIKSGCKQQYKVSLLNSVMPYLLDETRTFCEKNNIRFHVTNGHNTHIMRELYGLPKDHSIDAYIIALSVCDEIAYIDTACNTYTRRRYKKKSNNNISKVGQREYYFENKLVAINRHKAEGQHNDSLEEYKSNYCLTHTEEELLQHLRTLQVKPAKRIYTSYKYNRVISIHTGDVVKYLKVNKTNGVVKTQTFVAESVKTSKNYILHDKTKGKLIQYCITIQSGCLQYN